MQLISGKEIANDLAQELKEAVVDLRQAGVVPGLTVILVGDNQASQVYVRNKGKRASELGINYNLIQLPKETTQIDLLNQIDQLNRDDSVDGILVQLPLPDQIDEDAVIEAISPLKDVDGFSPVNFGHLWQNTESIIPSTAGGIMTMLEKSNIAISGKHVVIINRSNIVGRPLGALMLNQDATVTFVHSKTEDLPSLTKQADILVSAVGQANFVTADMVKKGAVVIDVGMNRDENNKLVGDVDFKNVAEKTSFITPVPGGVGPMTIITLMQQLIKIATKRLPKK